MAKSHIPIGIDLGTTYSAIAYLDNEGRPCTITNSEGELTTPSVVYFDRDCVIVGTEANHAGETDIQRLARAAKRDMGGSRYRKKILDRFLPPEVIQSFVLKRLKEDAELKLGEITQAVVTVPAYFNEPRRKATQDAAELAGLEIIDIINEPTAAALAYGIQRGFLDEKGTSETLERVLVYDLGGGTFDATLMEINNSHFKAIATAGDVHLGGIDWDQRIFDFATNELETKHKLDFQSDKVFQERLLNQCLRAKKALSARSETAIRLEHNGERYNIEFTREQFKELTKDLLERTRLTTDRLLRDAKLKWSDLTKLLLVGGSTRMPMVLEMLERESGLIVDRSLSPDESVAHGAAIYAGILLKHGSTAGQGISVSNVNSHDLGVLGIDPKTRAPRRRVVIPRNHRLPANATKKFQTSKDGQKKIVVQVVEGGTDEGMGATTIGKCVVTDLPPEIKQGTEVLVGFNYLSSGRLQVVAEIPSLKLSADSAIDRSEGMNPEEITIWKKKLASGVATLLNDPPIRAKAAASASPIKADKPAKKVPPREKREPTLVKVADKSAADKQPVVTKQPKSKPAANKKTIDRKPVSAKHSTIDIETGFERKPDIDEAPVFEDVDLKTMEFEVSENSGIFAFDDDDPKVTAGQSILDFLDQAEKKQASASGSALDEFLTDLNRE